MRLIINSEPIKVYASGNQDVNHLAEKYKGKTPDIIDNAFVIVDFENGVRGLLDLCMFAENSEYQEEIVAIGDIGKIETFVPSNASGKDSSEVRIGLRKDNVNKSKEVKVDKDILAAKALSIMNARKITSLCVYNKKNKSKTIGILHIHNVLENNVR